MKYLNILIDTIMNMHLPNLIDEFGDVDLNGVSEEFKEQCPGNFKLIWKNPNNKLRLFDLIDINLIDILFENDKEQVEWKLRYG